MNPQYTYHTTDSMDSQQKTVRFKVMAGTCMEEKNMIQIVNAAAEGDKNLEGKKLAAPQTRRSTAFMEILQWGWMSSTQQCLASPNNSTTKKAIYGKDGATQPV